MKMHKIAGLYTLMDYRHETLEKQAAAYVADQAHRPEIVIQLEEPFFQKMQRENPHLSVNDCEYIWTGAEFYRQLLNHQGFMLHASGVVYEGRAYLFSAPSGTGKSTHTGLWLHHFGSDAKIINDDKPAIRIQDGDVFVYGTPWSGKTDLNLNMRVPLQAICFLERAEQNEIHSIQTGEAIGMIMNQTLRPTELEQMDKLLSCLDVLLRNIPVYRMGCNISEDAVRVAYQAMCQQHTAENNGGMS